VTPKLPIGRGRRERKSVSGFKNVSMSNRSYNPDKSCSAEDELRVVRNAHVRQL
jgi:hypothetical protein